MDTNTVKVNMLTNNLKSILSLFLISLILLSTSTQISFAQTETNINKYFWSNKNFLKEINKERTKKKLGKLRENTELNKLAQLRLEDMVKNNYFAHESPTGNGIDDLLLTSTYDYEWRGENLAYGEFTNEADVTKSWMNSKWHKYNILYKNFGEVGTAHTITEFKGGKYLVVVQVFGKENKITLAKK